MGLIITLVKLAISLISLIIHFIVGTLQIVFNVIRYGCKALFGKEARANRRLKKQLKKSNKELNQL